MDEVGAQPKRGRTGRQERLRSGGQARRSKRHIGKELGEGWWRGRRIPVRWTRIKMSESGGFAQDCDRFSFVDLFLMDSALFPLGVLSPKNEQNTIRVTDVIVTVTEHWQFGESPSL